MFISSPLSPWWLLLLHNVLSHKIQALHSTTIVQAVLILYYFVMWAMRAMPNCETGIWGCSRGTDNGNKSNVNSHQSWSQIQLDLENPSLRQEKSLSDVGWPWRLSLNFIAHHSSSFYILSNWFSFSSESIWLEDIMERTNWCWADIIPTGPKISTNWIVRTTERAQRLPGWWWDAKVVTRGIMRTKHGTWIHLAAYPHWCFTCATIVSLNDLYTFNWAK